mgnify:CR=1 FL=1
MGEKASNQEVRERHREFLSIICPKHLKYIPFTSSLFLMKYFFLIIMFSVSSVLSLSQASALLVTPDEYVEWAYNQQLTRYNTVEAFRYDATLSRQEAAALLVRAAEKIFEITPPSNPVCNPYRDASSFDTSLQDEIYRACTFGMMQGSRGYFFPLELLARDQTLVILMRAID